jgi:ADP-L-glycero-D-manno-heptose 6-epimerase
VQFLIIFYIINLKLTIVLGGSMIIVTGGSGFIGSAIISELNNRKIKDIIVVDYLSTDEKWKNLVNLKFLDYLERDAFLNLINSKDLKKIKAIIHMGACSSTTETDASYLIKNNFEYTKDLAKYCIDNKVRFIYASSAATYGDGSNGYSDASIDNLVPLNMYGYSKHMFDLWARTNKILDKIVGLKFFNVYGPNEYHKGDMKSVVNKAFYQIKEKGFMQLFKSYRSDYKDGEQKRDFIYIKDAVKMALFFLDHKNKNGIFNIATGVPRTWNDLALAVFKAMGIEEKIEYIEMPENLRNKYQYFTQGNIMKLQKAGYKEKINTLEEGVEDYVKNYLALEGKCL